ncbi:MobA/MobL family protein, partial [Agathobaculum butyriciproducens]|nr:MobA/MobL family protein [Agathobaculum butyriciproducens]
QYLAPENQIDHRSFKRQGIERIPTIHEGYAAKQMERRGLVSERMELNREIKRLNQIISKLKDTVLGIGKRLMELKDNLMKVRMHYGERNIAKR